MITQAFVVDCRLDLRKSFEFWTIGFEGGMFLYRFNTDFFVTLTFRTDNRFT